MLKPMEDNVKAAVKPDRLTSCVLQSLVSLCEPQFPYLQHENNSQNLVRIQYDNAYDLRL